MYVFHLTVIRATVTHACKFLTTAQARASLLKHVRVQRVVVWIRVTCHNWPALKYWKTSCQLLLLWHIVKRIYLRIFLDHEIVLLLHIARSLYFRGVTRSPFLTFGLLLERSRTTGFYWYCISTLIQYLMDICYGHTIHNYFMAVLSCQFYDTSHTTSDYVWPWSCYIFCAKQCVPFLSGFFFWKFYVRKKIYSYAQVNFLEFGRKTSLISRISLRGFCTLFAEFPTKN